MKQVESLLRVAGISFLIFALPGLAGAPDFRKAYASDAATRLLLHFDGDRGAVGDASAFGHRGRLAGAAAVKAEGRFGRGLVLDGESAAVVFAPAGSLSPGDAITFEAWIKPAAVDGLRQILAKNILKPPWYQYHLQLQKGRAVAGVTTARAHLSVMSDSPVPVGTWTHLAGAFDGKALRLYVNGVRQSSVAAGEGPLVDAGGDLTVGRWGGSNYHFVGRIDEVRVSATDRYQAPADSPLSIVIRKAARTPTIDGRIDRAGGEWGGAGVAGTFLDTRRQPTTRPAPEVWMTFDDRGLYVGFVVPCDGGLKRDAVGRDGPVWKDDAIEVFLDPRRSRSTFYQFAVNAAGTRYDGYLKQKEWNAEWTYKATLTDGAWTGELAIPFAAFNLPTPYDGELWGVNICRTYARPQEYTSLAGTASFHDASALPDLVFVGGSSTATLGPSSFKFDWRVVGTGAKEVETLVDISGVPPRQRGRVRAAIAVLDSGGRTALRKTIDGFSAIKVPARLPVAGLAPGEYRLAVSLYDEKGRLADTKSTEFIKPDASRWAGNRIGMNDSVPAPWTPLAVDNHTVRCWNRAYAFGGGGWPAQITVGQEDLLDGPIRLTGRAGGRGLTWEDGELSFTQQRADKVVFDVASKASPVALQGTVAVEFDGMARFDLKLVPQGSAPVTVDELALEIPLKAQAATLKYILTYPTTDFYHPNILGTVGPDWQGGFSHQVWLGNEERGLTWFTESDAGWHLKAKDRALRIVRDKERVMFRVTLIDQPRRLAGPLALTFGLQATPVKPLPGNWQEVRMSCWQEHEPNVLIDWSFPWKERWFAFPAVKDVIRYGKEQMPYEALIAKYRKACERYVPYVNVDCASGGIPAYRYFEDDWRAGDAMGGPLGATTGDVAAFGFPLMKVCPATTWTDFYLDALQAFLDKYAPDGIYIDNACLNTCTNTSHGCGRLDGPAGRGRVPIFATRELQKRVYRLVKSHGKDNLVIAHAAGAITIPVAAFYDVYVEGERYYGVTDYMAKVPLDHFQAECIGGKWGMIPIFLPEIHRAEDIAVPGPTETMLALARIHGANVWPGMTTCHAETVRKIWRIESAFGMADTTFLPYWGNRAIVEPSSDQVKATIFAKRGKALMYISNFDAQKATARIRMDFRRLGLAPDRVEVTDPYRGQAVAMTKEGFDLPIEGKNFRLIVVTGK